MISCGLKLNTTLTSSPLPLPLLSGFQLQKKLSKSQRYLLPSQGFLFSKSFNQRYPVKCSLSAPNDNPLLNTVKPHVDRFMERLLETFPEPAKEFPWKKAEEMVFQRLLILGKKAMKWLLLVLFVISSLSDVLLSISRNRELLIPLGLYLGCLMTDLLKETSQELFQATEVKDVLGHLVGIGSFFVLVKFIALCMPIGGRLFLSHLSNGGLMQVLWLGKKLKEEKDDENDKQSSPQLSSNLVTNT